MTLQIELTPEEETRLRKRATALGLNVPLLVKQLIDREMPPLRERKLTGRGKFAHVNISSEDVRRDRQEEIEKEEAAFRRRYGKQPVE